MIYRRVLAIACFMLLLLPSVSLGGLQKKTVESQGMGSSLNHAIYDALDEAIGRVNGKSIESRKQLDSVEVSEVNNDKEDYYAAEAVQQKIKTATKGVVDGYEILSSSQREDGLWQVTISVTVVKFIQKDSNRKRIAVFPLQLGSGAFLVNGSPVNKDRVGRVATQNLASTLVQSRKFTVLDREYIKETVGEQGLALSANSPVSEMARLGQEMVADFILVGTLENIGFAEKKVKMQSSGRELTSRQGSVELSVRLIDVSTREIVFSDFLKMNVSESDLKRFGASLTDEGPEAGIAIVAADRVGRKILETIYPFVVVSVSGETITIGQGGSQLKVGDRLEVFMYGERLTDPYTKEFLGREEIRAGLAIVTRVNSKQANAKLVESSMNVAEAFAPKKFICRAELQAPDAAEVKREERRKERDKRRKEKDNDW